MATLEAEVGDGADVEQIRQSIKQVLKESFGIDHTTVEIGKVGATGEMSD